MASSFLKKKAEEQAKRIDKQYGATAYGGSSSRTSSGGKTESKNKETEKNTEVKFSSNGSRSSSWLQQKAREQAERIDREYGADAYGGSNSRIVDKEAGLRDWMSSLDSFSKRMSDEYAKREGVYQDANALGKYKTDAQSEALRMQNQAKLYRTYFEDNRSKYGDDTVNEILKALDEGSTYLTDTHDALGSEYDYWSQFKDENEYNEYTRLSALDLEASQKELDELTRQMEQAKAERDAAYNQLMRADRYGAPDRLLARSGGFEEKDAVYQELNEKITKLNRDIYTAQHYQDSAKYNAYMGAEDFGNFTGTVEPEDNKYMSEDERKIYNYVLAKEGEDAAQQYLDHLEEAINYRKGKAQGEYIEGIDNWWLKSQVTGISAAVGGFNNFGRGIKQLFTDEMLATNPQQYADAYLMESLADDGFQVPFTDKSVSQLAYEGISTVTNMAPSILVSYAATKLGAPQAAASLLAAGTLGASAGGNAYTQALQDGYTKDQARNYGIAVGASEGALQYLLGGISKLSGTGNLTNKMLAKVSSIDNGLLRAAAAAGVKGAGEVVEEELQNYLEPLYRKILFNEEYTAPEIEDVVYTAVLTFLTTGVLEADSISSYASNAPKTYGKQIKGADALQGLIESGLESAPDTESRALAENIAAKQAAGKEVNDWEVGRLQIANDAAIRAEAAETAPETLEDVAMEVVARENRSAQAATEAAKSVPYNVMSVDNPARQSAVAQKQRNEDYANALGYGEHGKAALQSISEQAEVSMEQANTEFHLPYLRGLSNMEMSEAEITSDTQLKAFNAGRMDRIQSMNLDADRAAFATVHGKESGLVQSAVSKKYDKKAVAVLNKASKAFGTKTMLVDEIWQKDGKIVPKGTEGAAEADAAMQSNGVMLVSMNAGDPLYTLTKHEFTHRFQQLAPAEYQQYRDAVMQYVVAGDAVAATSTVERYQNRLGLNVNRSADEIAADFSAYLMKDVNEASRFFDSLLDPKKNTVEQVKKNRNMLERFMDAARAFVQKIKQAFGGDKSKMDAAAQEAFGGTVEQLQELEKLWKQAAEATAKAVQKKVESGTEQEYNGGRKAQFHMKGDSRDGEVGAFGERGDAGSQRVAESRRESAEDGRRDGSNDRKDARGAKGSRLFQTDQDFRRRAESALGTYFKEFYNRKVDEFYALYDDNTALVLGKLYRVLDNGKAAFVDEFKGVLPEVEMLADRLLAALSVSDPAVVFPTGSYGKADEAYFAAIRKGDYAAAANMVQEAAKANGYTVDVWHGSDTNGITVFRTFSDNEFGLHMGSKQAAEDRLNDTVGSFGYMYHLYMNPGKSKQLPDIFGEYTAMFDYVNYLHGDYEQMSDPDRGYDVVLNDASEFPKNSAFYAMAKQVQNTVYSKARTLSDIRKCNELMQKYLKTLDYDSFYYENEAEDEGSTSYIVLDPDRVKSAEVMTFDNDGKVIPLSQRFDASKEDIRFSMKKDSNGNSLTKEQQEYFKDSVIRDKNGNLMPMYHGTKRGGFTVFDGGKDYWYFTNDEKYAYTFEGRKDTGEFYPVVKEGIESGVYTPQRYTVYLNVKNPFVTDDADIIEDALYWDKTLAGELRKKGYDALMFEDMSQVIVLNANQIKNTTNKKPTDDPDIRFSMKDSAGNKLSQEQAEYFKDSKVRDENGNLKVVYHGSPAQFTKFSYDFMGSTGSAEGRGFYFTDKKAMAEGYQRNGGQLMEGYLSITKPLSLTKKTIKRAELTKLLKAIDPTGDDIASNYDMSGGVGYPSKAWYTRAMNDTVRTIWDGNDNDADILAEIANSGSSNETVLKTAKKLFGYDGYIADGKYDGASVYVAFSSEQFKNADNLNPTSDPDVRFSMKKSDRDYMAAIENGDMNTVRRMVSEAAIAAGFADAVPEQTLAYKTRTGKAPKKTIKVYKVFTVTPDGKPTALFVSGTATLPQDVWLDAQDTWHFTAKNGKEYVPSTQNPYTDGGKTGGQVEIPNDEVRQELIRRGFLPEGSKAKNITALAYRPGWHAGDLPFFPQGGMKREGSNYPNIHRYNQVVFECELDADYDYTEYARSQDKAKKKDGTVNDREADLQEMPTGGYYKYATNPLTKGGENGTWFISGSLKIGRALTQEECDRILAENGFLPQEWEQGTLDLASLGYTGQQHDAARKTLAPITYDDAGNIIPLSQRFTPEVNDIRYSTKGQGDLLAENAKLREVNAELREQFKTTKFAKVDKKSLDAFAKKLLKDYQSGADINETRDALDALYTYIANGENGEAPVWNEAYKRAYETAVSILENASQLNDDLYQEYSALRKELKTRAIRIDKSISSDLMGYGSIEEFRKANFGRILMTNDGVPVDVYYSDLASRYPEFFDEYEHTNSADQLLHIAEVLDSLQPTEVNPYSYNMREGATWLANDIMERFFELPQAKPTFADKAQQKLTKQVIHDAKKLERLRAEKNERIAQVIKREKERTGEVRMKEREKRSKAVKQVKEYYLGKQAAGSERRNSAVLRKRIAQHASDLSKKLLRPTDNQHIPENLRTTVAAVLEAINLESQFTVDPVTGKRSKGGGGDPVKRTDAFRKLKEVYSKILQQEGADMVIDPSLLGNAEEGFDGYFDAVLGMSDTKLADMNLNQLEIVWRVIRAVERSITTAGKLLASKKFESTVEWANAFEEDTDTKRRLKGSKVEALRLDLENPYTFFAHYGKAGEAVFRMLRDAQDAQQRMVEAVDAEVRKIVDPKQVKQWEKEVHEFKTARGEKLVLTVAHMMEIHELMKREQARDHLTKGGIVQPEIKSKKIRRGTDAVLLSLEDIMQIVGKLTQDQMNVADELQGLMTGILADYGNEASMRAYGYEKFTGTDYFPIKSAKEGVHSNIEKGGNNSRSIKNIGLAKSVIPHASNALDIGGIFSTFASHAADMADYAAWLCPMEDANRLYNFQFRDEMGQRSGFTMKGLLDRYGGNGAQKYWHNLMEDIQNGISAPGDTTVMNIINKGIGNARAASVGANIRVIVQQPTAFLRAAMVLNPADMVKGMAAAATKGGGWKKALKYSEIAKRKDMGGFDISSPAQMNEILFDSKTNLQKFNDAMMWGAGKADAVTWGKIWNACEWAVKGEGKLETGSEEFYERTAELFAEVIDQSQVVDGVLQRSQMMRSSNALVKQATAFMGEPTMALNMMLRAYDGLRNEQDTKKRGAAIKRFGRAAVVLLATNAVNAFAQSLVDAWRDDEDDEYWEKLKAAFFGKTDEEKSAWENATDAFLSGNIWESVNPIGYVPFAKDLLSILQGYNVTRADADVLADIVYAYQAFEKSVRGEGTKTLANATWNLAKQVGKVFGISAPNMTRDIYGILRTIAQGTGNIAAQYELEKWIYQVSNKDNASRFMDILYKAYTDDKVVFDKIYAEMLENDYYKTVKDSGEITTTAEYIADKLKPDLMDDLFALYKDDHAAYKEMYNDLLMRDFLKKGVKTGNPETDTFVSTAETIAKAMETRMKKDQGVKSVSDLDQRYLSPKQQPKWDSAMSKISSNSLWRSASSEERDKLEDKLYGLVTENASGEEMREKISEGAKYDLDETEYLLYQLALDMYDQPSDKGEYGSYNSQEKADALLAAGLGDSEIAYLWNTDESYEAYDDGVDMENYVRFKAGVSGLVSGVDYKKNDTDSRKAAINALMRELGITGSDRDWLYHTEYKK